MIFQFEPVDLYVVYNRLNDNISKSISEKMISFILKVKGLKVGLKLEQGLGVGLGVGLEEGLEEGLEVGMQLIGLKLELPFGAPFNKYL